LRLVAPLKLEQLLGYIRQFGSPPDALGIAAGQAHERPMERKIVDLKLASIVDRRGDVSRRLERSSQMRNWVVAAD
jgi:hypothetical protein